MKRQTKADEAAWKGFEDYMAWGGRRSAHWTATSATYAN